MSRPVIAVPTRAAAILLVAALTACRPHPKSASASAGNITVTGAFALAPLTPDVGAAYFTIRNTDTVPDTLRAVVTEIASMAVLHSQLREGGGMRMQQLVQLEIPPGGEVVLSPGGTHLMLMEFKHVPRAGEKFPLTLDFAHAGKVSLELPVRAYSDAQE